MMHVFFHTAAMHRRERTASQQGNPMRIILSAVSALVLLATALPATAQAPASPSAVRVTDDDVARFWTAYDAVRATQDPAEQRDLFQRLYIDQGTPGLAAFMEAKGYTADTYLNAIRAYPKYWDTVRPRTALAAGALDRLEGHLARLHALYPDLRPAGVYFEIGALRSAGTAQGDKVLIGVEMAAGDDSVDVSQMPPGLQRFFGTYFASRPLDNLDLLATHEFVHTQQNGERQTLLGQAVYEGVADFVAEKAAGRLPDLPYVAYGPANDATIKAAFRKDMMENDYSGWLYNGMNNAFGVADLGYYVGYAITSRYYERAADKALAIKTMLELDYADQAAVQAFVDASGYFDE